MRAKNLAEQLDPELGLKDLDALRDGCQEVSQALTGLMPKTWTAWWKSSTYWYPDLSMKIGCVASAEIRIMAPNAQDPALTICVRVYRSETDVWIKRFSATIASYSGIYAQYYSTAAELMQDIQWVWAEDRKQELRA